MIVLCSTLLFVGCVKNNQSVKLKPLVNEETYPIQMYTDNSSYENNLDTSNMLAEQHQTEALNKRSAGFEKIPSFQKNDFQRTKTNTRKEKRKEIVVDGGSVKVNVESIPLSEFIDFIFSNVLKMNYSVDKNIKKMTQPITLNMAKPLPKKQVLSVVTKILDAESIGLTQESGNLFIKQSSKRNKEKDFSNREIILGRTLPSNIDEHKQVVMFVPFYYTNPKTIKHILRNFGLKNVKLEFLSDNIQILAGEAFDVGNALELIRVVDAPSMENKIPYLVELKNIDVKKFTERMEAVLKSNSIPIATSIRELGMVLTPIEEINAVLVISSKKSWLDMVLFWKEKLDVIVASGDSPQLYFYKIKNRKADELATVLQDVLTSVDEGKNKANILVSNDNNRSNFSELDSTSSSINIKADLHTNSLMMNVTSSEYRKILPIIKQLDQLPLQVLVEVTLAEIDITDSFNLGFEWTLLNNKAISGTSTQTSGAHTLAIGGTAGITSTLFTNNLTSVINAFAEKKVLDIVSRPRLIILNNKTGNINVGQQVPVVSSEASADDLSTTSSSSILRNISYVTTGMTLNLTPTISSNGTLTLDISITLSEAQTNQTSSIDSPLIVNRSLTTSAVMQSGNSILLGGIISHNKSNGDTGVPILKDLPMIGNIFKSQSKSHVKTELIMLIHPKIIKNNYELERETETFKLLLKNLKSL